jgi:hypothetical protein
MSAEHIVAIIGSFMGFCGICVTAVFSFLGHRNTRQINDAVNNVHHHGGERIYDLVVNNAVASQKFDRDLAEVRKHTEELIEWKRGYEDSPWRDGGSVKKWLKEHENVLEKAEDKTTRIFANPTLQQEE